jgi:hypothetical protein
VLSGKRALIVADDAKDPIQIRPLLPPVGCGLLVTSRSRFSLPGMLTINLGPLPLEEAEKLLLTICPRIGEHAWKLAQLCSYLPLALRVSASVLQEHDTRDVAHYINQLQAERLTHLSDPDNPNDPDASVDASLQLSYSTLEPVPRETLCQLSVFPASFDSAAAKTIVKIDADIEEALAILWRRSLVEWDNITARYSVDDLVRAFGTVRLENAEEVRLRYAHYYADVAAHAQNDLYLKGEVLAGLALFDQARIHIDTGWAWAMTHVGNRDADVLVLRYAVVTTDIGELRYNTQRERIPQLETALAAARRLGDQRGEGTTLDKLGNAYSVLPKFRPN